MINKRIIIGYSGHAYVVIDAVLSNNLKMHGYTDLDEKSLNPFNLEYLGNESSDSFLWNKEFNYFLGIGNNEMRKKSFQNVVLKGCLCSNSIHKTAVISDQTTIGSGCFISANTVLNPLCSLGDGVIVNTSATIEHECEISNFVHVAPGAVLCGNVKVGSGSFIGANTVVKEGVSIGSNTVIGAGSVVVNDIGNNMIVYGNPAK